MEGFLQFARAKRWIIVSLASLVLVAVGVGYIAVRVTTAAPAISVGVSCTDALLGTNTTCTVSVTNTGPDRGYGLSMTGAFSSSLLDPDGRVSIVNNPDYPYSSHAIDPATGDTTVTWVDIRDLASGEDFSFAVEVDFDETTGWDVGEVLTAQFDAEIYESPALTGPVTGADSDTATLVPILFNKSYNQSTGQQQATGIVNPFTFTLSANNNYVNPTDVVEVRDTVPDGIEFIPANDPSTACSIAPTTATQNADESWDLVWAGNALDGDGDGIFDPFETVTITCDVYIRYDYEETGLPVADDTGFPNDADLDYHYPVGDPATVTLTDSPSVTGTFLTVNKSDDQADFGTDSDNTIVYTVGYSASEYYTTDTIRFTDELGDGHIYCSGAGTGYDPGDGIPGEVAVADCTQAPTLVPTSVTENVSSTGQITLVFDIPALPVNAEGSFSYETVVAQSYGGYGGSDIVAGDTLSNGVEMTFNYTDDTGGGNNGSGSESASSSTPATQPSIDKTVCHPELTGDPATCEDADFTDDPIDLTVGDQATFRVAFDSPTNIDTRGIVVTDWVPSGFSVDSVTENPGGTCSSSPDGNFVGGDPNTAVAGSAFGLDYYQWDLGDVVTGSTWCAEIVMTASDDPTNQDGNLKSNLWKMQGENVLGDPYSERDGIDITIQDANLVLEKSDGDDVNGGNVVPGDEIEHSVTIENAGLAQARDLLFHDDIPGGMQSTTPTIQSVSIDGGPTLVEGSDFESSYAAGAFEIDFNTASVETNLDAGSVLTIVYRTTVDAGLGAGATLTNTASVAYNTQDDGSGRQTDFTTDPADDNTDDGTISLASPTFTKTVPEGIPADPITVGEQKTYQFFITVPAELNVYDPVITDRFNRDGFTYSSETIGVVSGSCSAPGGTGPWSYNADGANSDYFTYSFNGADIDNSANGTDCIVRVELAVVYDGLEDNGTTWEFWSSTGGGGATQSAGDSADLDWSTVDGAGNDLLLSTSSVDVGIDQPEIVANKTHSPSGPFQGGDQFQYTVTLLNDGYDDAYDVVLNDELPAGLTLVSVDSVVDEGGAPIAGYADNSVVGGTTVQIDFNGSDAEPLDDANSQDEIEVVYTVEVDGNIAAGVTLTNDVDADWRSLDGAGRNYDEDTDSEEDWPGDETTDDVDITDASVSKVITGPTAITVGETTTVTATITVPAETVAYWPDLEDQLNTDGFEYVASSAGTGNFSGDLDGTDSVTFVDSGTTSANAADVTTDTAGADSTSFTFDLNTIDNADTGSAEGDAAFTFDLTYDLLYTGLEDDGSTWEFWGWDAGDESDDTLTLNWNSSDAGNGTTDISSGSNTETVAINQPLLSLEKLVEDPGSPGVYLDGPFDVVGGDGVSYRTLVENNGDATAYDITWEDDIDTTMLENPTLDLVELDADGDGTYETTLVEGTEFVSNFTGDPLLIDFSAGTVDTDLIPTGKIRVTYSADVRTNVGAGAQIDNTADVDWSSVDGADPDERVYNDTPQEDAQFNGDEDTETVEIPDPVITKTGDVTEATIGQEYTYTIEVSVPLNTTAYDTEIRDNLPDGATYVSHSTTPAIGAVTVNPEQPDGTTLVEWAIGDIPNPPTATVEIEITVRLDDGYSLGGDLDGLPTPRDGDPQDVITNEGELIYAPADGGATTSLYDDHDVTVEEPLLELQKAVSSHPSDGGDTGEYSVDLVNIGQSTAHSVTWEDDAAGGLLVNGSLVSVESDVHGTLTDGVDFSSDFSGAPFTIDFEGGSGGDTTIAVGETITITYEADVSGSAGAGFELENTADVDWYSADNDTATNPRNYNDSESYTGDTDSDSSALSEATLDKGVDPGSATIGQEIIYTYLVDTADLTAFNAELADTLPDGVEYVSHTIVNGPGSVSEVGGVVTWTIGDFNSSGGLGELEVVVRVLDEYADTTKLDGVPASVDSDPVDSLTNDATLSWEDEDSGGSAYTDDDDATFTVEEPVLDLDKTTTDVPNPLYGGDTIEYQSTFTNIGLSTAYGVTWEDDSTGHLEDAVLVSVVSSADGPLAAGVDFSYDFSANPITIDFTGGTTGHNVVVGETITISYTADVDSLISDGQIIINYADVNWYSLDPLTATDPRHYDDSELYVGDSDFTTNYVASAALVKTSGATEATIGEEFDYTITVDVASGSAIFDSVLTDTIPDGLTYVSHSETPAVGSVVVGAEASGETPITWTIGDVSNPPTATYELTVTVRVDDAYDGGTPLDGVDTPGDGDAQDTITNEAQFVWANTDGGATSQITDDHETTVEAPLLTLEKDVTNVTDPGATAEAGDTLLFTITVENVGAGDAHDVQLEDDYPAGLTYVAASATDGGVDDTNTITWTDLTIPAGATRVITYQMTIDGGVLDDTTLTNGVTLSEYSSVDGPDANERTLGPLTADTDIDIAAGFLEVQKELTGDDIVQVGNSVDYRVTVTNDGNASVYNLEVTDTMPSADFSYEPGSAYITVGAGLPTQTDPTESGVDLTWTVGQLDPGETVTIEYAIVVGSTAVSGEYTNTVVAVADDGAGTPTPADGTNGGSIDDDPDDTDIAQFTVTEVAYEIVKTVLSPEEGPAIPGDAVRFEMALTNTGDTTLAVVPFTDIFNANVFQFVNDDTFPKVGLNADDPVYAAPDTSSEGSFGYDDLTEVVGQDLAPGESVTILAKFIVLSGNEAGKAKNIATVSDVVDENGDPGMDQESEVDVELADPSYTLAKDLLDPDDDVAYKGDEIVYRVQVKNTGDVAINELKLRDDFDSSVLEYSEATVEPDGINGEDDLVWKNVLDAPLGVGEKRNIDITFVVTGVPADLDDPIFNTAYGTRAVDENGRDVSDEEAENEELIIFTHDELEFVKTADPADGSVVIPRGLTGGEQGTIITYSIVVSNDQDDDLENVVVTDRLPDPLEYIPGTLTYKQKPMTDEAGDDVADFGITAPNTATFNIGIVPKGKKRTVTFQARVKEYTEGLIEVMNEAVLDADALQPTASNRTYHPIDPFEVEKTAEDLNGGAVQSGDELEYTIKVTNVGNTPTTNVVVTDELPEELTYVTGSIRGAGANDVDPAVLVWNVGPIGVGATAELTFRAVVSDGLLDNYQLENVVLVTSDQSAREASASITAVIGEELEDTGATMLTVTFIGLLMMLGGTGYIIWRVMPVNRLALASSGGSGNARMKRAAKRNATPSATSRKRKKKKAVPKKKTAPKKTAGKKAKPKKTTRATTKSAPKKRKPAKTASTKKRTTKKK